MDRGDTSPCLGRGQSHLALGRPQSQQKGHGEGPRSASPHKALQGSWLHILGIGRDWGGHEDPKGGDLGKKSSPVLTTKGTCYLTGSPLHRYHLPARCEATVPVAVKTRCFPTPVQGGTVCAKPRPSSGSGLAGKGASRNTPEPGPGPDGPSPVPFLGLPVLSVPSLH